MPKRKAPQRPDAGTRDYTQVVQSLVLTDSDRAAGVLGRAYAEVLLEKLLFHYLADESLARKLLVESASAPLGSLSARINVAYCLGLLPQPIYDDLHIIREVGNHFAHHLDVGAGGWGASPVLDWCANLWASRHDPKSFEGVEPAARRARQQFNTALVFVAVEIDNAIERLQRRQVPAPTSEHFRRRSTSS